MPVSDYVRVSSSNVIRKTPRISDSSERYPIPSPDSPPASYEKDLAWTIEYDPRVEKDLKAIDRAMRANSSTIWMPACTRKTRAVSVSLCSHERPVAYGATAFAIAERIICEVREEIGIVFVIPIKHRPSSTE